MKRTGGVRPGKINRPKPRVSKALSKKQVDDVLLEPWFLPKKVAASIQHLLPQDYRRRMSYFFEDYGCLRCHRKDVPYGANGMCNNCRVWVKYHMLKSLQRRNIKENLEPQMTPKERSHAFRRAKAISLLEGLAPKKRVPLQKARSILTSRSWRRETIQMPFGPVEFIV